MKCSTFLSTRDGHCYYRTTMFRSLPRARAFARCLQANPRFRAVSVKEATSGTGWHVIYQPSSQARYAELYYQQYRQRELKGAQTEGRCYRFELVTRGTDAYYLCQSVSKEVYDVTECSCSCPDWTYRGQKSGIPCKHIFAYHRAVAIQEIEALTSVRIRLQTARNALYAAALKTSFEQRCAARGLDINADF